MQASEPGAEKSRQRERERGRAASRSRARTPSELLARRQQLMGAGGGAHGQPAASGHGSKSRDVGPASAADQSAEAKLESLSELLKAHRAADGEAGAPEEGNSGASSEQRPVMAAASEHAAAAAGQELQAAAKKQSMDDVYILLAKKEKDLQLAAELGKVLLERNEELSRANERIAEEYSHKLELLEQDKHKLKRKLDLLDGEYENRLIELQTDCNILKSKLEQREQSGRQADKEKSKLIDDLVQQNQRLTSELAEATKSEELLAGQLEQVNERLSSRLSNRSNHAAQVEALQAEISILNQRKHDLERRLKLAQSEKSNLNSTIDELGDKLLLFENLLNEKDLRIGELAVEINELRDSSSWLSAKLESMISLNEQLVDCAAGGRQQLRETTSQRTMNNGPQPAPPNNNEGDRHVVDLKTISERDRSQLVEQLKELRLKRSSRMKANEMILLEASVRRQQSSQLLATGHKSQKGTFDTSEQRFERRRRRHLLRKSAPEGGKGQLAGVESGDDGLASDENADESLSDLISEIYSVLKNFLQSLQQRREALEIGQLGSSGAHEPQLHSRQQQHNVNEDSGVGSADEATVSRTSGDKLPTSSGASSSSSSSSNGLGPDTVLNEPERWLKMINSIRQLIEEMPCSSCQLMIRERADFEQLKKLHSKVCDEIRLKNEEFLKLNALNIEQASRLNVLEDKCQLLTNDLENCDKPKEEIVSLAWKARDEAVARKNNAEIQLAKTRIENMQISSQLMEVVQQKGELSQKLAQFEDDIHYMMQRSVKAKFTWEEYAEETRRLANSRNGRSKLGQLTNTVPSSTPANAFNGYGQGSSSIQQLLSLTGVNLLSSARSQTNATSLEDQANDGASLNPANQDNASLHQQIRQATNATTTNLLTSLKSGTNKLKFWQRGSTQQDEQLPPMAANNLAVGME